MVKLMRVAVYARYSSDRQNEDSIEAQLRAIRKYCHDNGYLIVEEYIDEAYSATNDRRPAFQKMIADAKLRRFDLVVVHKLDRFSRNQYQSAKYKHLLKKCGIKRLSVLEPMLDGSPESVIVEPLLEGMAEYYSLNLAREVRKGQKEKALKASFLGGVPPLGYDIENKKFVINKYEAEAVQLIFYMYVRRYSYPQIVSALNQLGKLTKKKRPFRYNSLNAILRNERYTGVYIFNQTEKGNFYRQKPDEEIIRIPGAIPALIDSETWRQAQERMTSLRRAEGKARHTYMLTGIIRCANCGSPMVGRGAPTRTGSRYYYYACLKCGGEDGISRSWSIRSDRVENAIVNKLNNSFFTRSGAMATAKVIHTEMQKRMKQSGDNIRPLRQSLAAIDKEINNLVGTLAVMGSSEAIIAALKQKENEKNQLRVQLAKIEGMSEAVPSVFEIARALQRHGDLLALDEKDRAHVVRAYIKNVEVPRPSEAEPVHIRVSTVTNTDGSGDWT